MNQVTGNLSFLAILSLVALTNSYHIASDDDFSSNEIRINEKIPVTTQNNKNRNTKNQNTEVTTVINKLSDNQTMEYAGTKNNTEPKNFTDLVQSDLLTESKELQNKSAEIIEILANVELSNLTNQSAEIAKFLYHVADSGALNVSVVESSDLNNHTTEHTNSNNQTMETAQPDNNTTESSNINIETKEIETHTTLLPVLNNDTSKSIVLDNDTLQIIGQNYYAMKTEKINVQTTESAKTYNQTTRFVKPNTKMSAIQTNLSRMGITILNSDLIEFRRPDKNKYILQWTPLHNEPFDNSVLNDGERVFIDKNCRFTNCVVTKNKNLLGDYTKFDAVVFFLKALKYYRGDTLPDRRSQHQKYVLASIDPSDKYIIRSSRLDSYFNWTWTYHLHSDLKWPFFVIKDAHGKVVAPSNEVQWIKPENMLPVSQKLRDILRGKRKAIAWFDSCKDQSSNANIDLWKLTKQLKARHDIHVTKFGKCRRRDCIRQENEGRCNDMLRTEYYFYFVNEPSKSEDYFTDAVLRAYRSNVVPIVLGVTNYSRFLPDGSYINANNVTTETLAQQLHDLMHDYPKYEQYFKWTNHYSFHKPEESPETDPICKICELVNNESKIREISVVKDLRKFWNPIKYVEEPKSPLMISTKKRNKLCSVCKKHRRMKLVSPLEVLKQIGDHISHFIGGFKHFLKSL